MTFLIDAQLPPKICEIVQNSGFHFIHLEELPNGDESTDQEIISYSDTHDFNKAKDMDFYHSQMILNRPKKFIPDYDREYK